MTREEWIAASWGPELAEVEVAWYDTPSSNTSRRSELVELGARIQWPPSVSHGRPFGWRELVIMWLNDAEASMVARGVPRLVP